MAETGSRSDDTQRLAERLFSRLSWERQVELRDHPQPREGFEELQKSVSLRRWFSQWIPLRLFVFGFPVFIYTLGFALAVISDYSAEYLRDPVPLVFAALSLVFASLVFTFDRRLFETVYEIEPAFATDEASYYDFFGHLVERVYEPWPFTTYEGSRRFHPPTGTLLILGVVYVVGLSVTGIGQLPTHQPILVRLYLFLITLIGLTGLVAIAWVLSVVLVFMTIDIQKLDIELVLTRSDNNLGLGAYGAFVVSIVVRMFVGLAIGGSTSLTAPSAFVTSNFVFGSVSILLWFFGTQYGLHRCIVEAKRNYTRQLEQSYPSEVRGGVAMQELLRGLPPDDPEPDSPLTDRGAESGGTQTEQIRDVQAVLEVKRRVDELPDWPVNAGSIVKLSGTVVASALSVFGQPIYQFLINVV